MLRLQGERDEALEDSRGVAGMYESLSLSPLYPERAGVHVRAMQRERRQREKEHRDRTERNLARWTYAQDEDHYWCGSSNAGVENEER